MPVLTANDLHKSFGARAVFDGVSFSIEPGEKVGFIGANGSGKSTLFRMVAGEEGLDGGTFAFQRGLRLGSVSQEPVFTETDTILRAVAAGRPELLDVWDYEHRMESVLTRLRVIDWQRPLRALSGGERKRVALARVLVQQPDLLLLDEPTNHLDADTTLWLEDYLLNYPGAVMLITHDRYFLDRVVTRMIEVNRGELTPFPGGYTEYLEAKAERQARLAVEEDKRAKLLEQELAWVKRSPSARTGKQKARISRLGSTQRDQQEKSLPKRDAVEMRFGEPPRLGRTVLDLHGVTKSYDDRVLIRDFSTRLRAGERIGIVGPNGAGKTTLLRIVLGEEVPDAGRVKRGKNTRIAYYDQKRADLDPDANLLQAVSNEDWVEIAGKRVHVRSYMQSFLFPNEVQEQKVRTLSGGERNRLLLARLLLQDANLLILDEPTNDLDLPTLQVLESVLTDFPGCVLVVTHDRYFLDKVATGLFVFTGEGRVHRHEGGYDLYRRLRDEEERRNGEIEHERTPTREPAPKRDRTRKLGYREQQELKGMETAILEAEDERARLEETLADPTLYSDRPEDVAGITAEFAEAGEEVERLYARWAELEAIREGG